VEPIRERIEDFMRRYGYEGNRMFRALAVAAAILLALRALRAFRVLAVLAVIGAIVVVGGWLLISSLFPPMPRLSSTGAVVRNGVVAIVACGKKRGLEGMDAAIDHVPEPRMGTWAPTRKGECTVWYHHPPDAHQRYARHQRAH
jgi:ABC-type glucose/galactose transport system permease subunit